jgi:NitT/TauT family transport system ATP-binding protein
VSLGQEDLTLTQSSEVPSEGGTDVRQRAPAGPSAGGIVIENLRITFRPQSKGKRLGKRKLPLSAAENGEIVAVEGMNLEVRSGEFVCLIGPSGCGKSTVLNAIAGLITPKRGSVTHNGTPVTSVNTRVGYVTQFDSLLPWRSVQFNVELPLKIRGVPAVERREAARKILNAVGLAGFEDAFPSALSGGMRSRVLLARTMVYEPEALLMDEPFGALDALLRLEMQSELTALWRRTSPTVLYVTHDIDEALVLGDRIIVFSKRPAKVIGEYTIEADRPRDVRSDPVLGNIHNEIWDLLRPQV